MLRFNCHGHGLICFLACVITAPSSLPVLARVPSSLQFVAAIMANIPTRATEIPNAMAVPGTIVMTFFHFFCLTTESIKHARDEHNLRTTDRASRKYAHKGKSVDANRNAAYDLNGCAQDHSCQCWQQNASDIHSDPAACHLQSTRHTTSCQLYFAHSQPKTCYNTALHHGNSRSCPRIPGVVG